MNKVMLSGRLIKDPELRYAGETAICKYNVAVDRKFKKEGQPQADFINCIAFGGSATYAEKYFRKGTKLIITGRIQTGSYSDKEGRKIYTTDVVVEEQEFAESKKFSEENSGTNSYNSQSNTQSSGKSTGNEEFFNEQDGFMNIPDGIDEELPFS